MKWNRRPLAWAVVIAALAGRELAGQQRDTPRAARDTSERPFVRGGVYDKPFLTTLAGRTALGGYAEAHARYLRVDGARQEAGFRAKRFNLFTSTRVSDVVRLGAELEFEDGTEEIKLEYAAIDLQVHPALILRGGMLLSPLGKFNLSHDSPLNEFTDRPLVSTDLLGVALSEPGFGALGQFPVGRAGRLTYELYATNGFHDGLITDAGAGTSIPLGRGNMEDNNASPAVVGRVAVSPRVGWELGISGHHGAYNVFTSEGATVDERRDVSILVLDAESRVLGVTLSGEAAVAQVDVPAGLSGIYARRQHGAYAEAVWPFARGWVRTLPSSGAALKGRVDYVDFDTNLPGRSVAQWSLGLNFRPTSDSVLKLDFVRGARWDQFNNRSDHAAVLLSLATYF